MIARSSRPHSCRAGGEPIRGYTDQYPASLLHTGRGAVGQRKLFPIES